METFGQTITGARRRAGLSQKDVAARLLKEDGSPISPQYLNDLEHDRRNPPAEHLLAQFATLLNVPLDYLCFVAGQLPHDLRQSSYAPERVAVAFRAFRQSLAQPQRAGQIPQAEPARQVEQPWQTGQARRAEQAGRTGRGEGGEP